MSDDREKQAHVCMFFAFLSPLLFFLVWHLIPTSSRNCCAVQGKS